MSEGTNVHENTTSDNDSTASDPNVCTAAYTLSSPGSAVMGTTGRHLFIIFFHSSRSFHLQAAAVARLVTACSWSTLSSFVSMRLKRSRTSCFSSGVGEVVVEDSSSSHAREKASWP